MVPSEVEQWHSGINVERHEVAKRAGEAVRRYCERHGYAYIGRSKTIESIAEKLETGRVEVLAKIDDLFGCSIIIPSLAREEAVIDDLRSMFEEAETRPRAETHKNPDVFRFEATRFIGRLRITEVDDTRLGELCFEVQVRTAFEHAWSVATHEEAYKAGKIDWKLERLAAQMKALVEQLDSLAVTYEASADSIIRHPCEQTDCASLVLEEMQQLCADVPIPIECAPERWGLLAKNVVGLANAANWGKFLPLEVRVRRLTEAAKSEAIALGSEAYPRSISLFQFILGVAIERGVIPPKFRHDRYFPPISASMELLFPRTKEVAQRCQLGTASPQEPEPIPETLN